MFGGNGGEEEQPKDDGGDGIQISTLFTRASVGTQRYP